MIFQSGARISGLQYLCKLVGIVECFEHPLLLKRCSLLRTILFLRLYIFVASMIYRRNHLLIFIIEIFLAFIYGRQRIDPELRWLNHILIRNAFPEWLQIILWSSTVFHLIKLIYDLLLTLVIFVFHVFPCLLFFYSSDPSFFYVSFVVQILHPISSSRRGISKTHQLFVDIVYDIGLLYVWLQLLSLVFLYLFYY